MGRPRTEVRAKGSAVYTSAGESTEDAPLSVMGGDVVSSANESAERAESNSWKGEGECIPHVMWGG